MHEWPAGQRRLTAANHRPPYGASMSGSQEATPGRPDGADPSSGPCIGRRPLLQTCLAGGVAVLGVGALASCGAPPTTPAAPAPGTLADLGAVPVGQTTVITTANGAPVALTRPTANSVIAHSAVCTHQGCTVAPAGATLNCPCHGSVFDAATGAVRQGPADRPLPEIPVRIQGQSVVAS